MSYASSLKVPQQGTAMYPCSHEEIRKTCIYEENINKIFG